MTSRTFLAVLLTSLLLVACGGGRGGRDIDDGESNPQLSQSTTSASLSGDSFTFSFDVNPGSEAVQLVLDSGSGIFNLVSLRDPSGAEIVASSTAATSQAQALSGPPTTVNFPFLGGTLLPGTYSAVFQLSSGAPASTGTLTVLQKSDADLRNGNLRLNMILYGPVAGTENIRKDLRGCVNILKEIFSRAGISLDSEFYEFQGSDLLPDPRSGAEIYATIARAVRPLSVNVVFASSVQGLSSPDNRFGRSGATPGPGTLTARSIIALSILQLTGNDGDFDTDRDRDDNNYTSSRIHNDELRLAAEEVARLVSQYLGLENIVEFQGSRVIATDSLQDTESCITIESCRDHKLVRTNVMMPRPIGEREDRSEFYPREAFTEQQRLVLNRHVFVD